MLSVTNELIMLNAECYAECPYLVCRYAECRGATNTHYLDTQSKAIKEFIKYSLWVLVSWTWGVFTVSL